MAEIKLIKLQASTLLEVVVAMVISMISFGIGMMIYMNVVNGSYPLERVVLNSRLLEIAEQTKVQRSFVDETYEEGGVTIYKKIRPYGVVNDLLILNIEAFDNGSRKLAVRNELILNQHNDE